MSDPRTLLIRDGLAAAALEGDLQAARYRVARPHVVAAPVTPLRKSPDPAAEQVSQLLFGERFDVLDFVGDFAFGQSGRDGYVGYAHRDLLHERVSAPHLRVTAIRTYAFTEPSIKSLAYGLYSLNSLVEEEARDGRFVKAVGGGWFVSEHLRPVGEVENDPVAVAERFLGAPYFWGGVESLGLDCSGLVQQSLRACGLACPRDSDQQQALGGAVEGREQVKRGDLVFWRGHVAMMRDDLTMIHANARQMAVTIERLDEAIVRIAAGGGGYPVAWRRPI